jgi:hypothetical protein
MMRARLVPERLAVAWLAAELAVLVLEVEPPAWPESSPFEAGLWLNLIGPSWWMIAEHPIASVDQERRL